MGIFCDKTFRCSHDKAMLRQYGLTRVFWITSFNQEITLYHGDEGLNKVLEDAKIRAVIIVLPVQVQLQVLDCPPNLNK